MIKLLSVSTAIKTLIVPLQVETVRIDHLKAGVGNSGKLAIFEE